MTPAPELVTPRRWHSVMIEANRFELWLSRPQLRSSTAIQYSTGL